jgi:hypothetical protein
MDEIFRFTSILQILNLICKDLSVHVAISAIKIQAIAPISMKFGTVEDYDPGMVFMYVRKKSSLRLAS